MAIPGGSFLGGDGWSLSANDQRGDSAYDNSTGAFGERNTTINKGGAVSMVGLIGIAAVVLGGLYLTNR